MPHHRFLALRALVALGSLAISLGAAPPPKAVPEPAPDLAFIPKDVP